MVVLNDFPAEGGIIRKPLTTVGHGGPEVREGARDRGGSPIDKGSHFDYVAAPWAVALLILRTRVKRNDPFVTRPIAPAVVDVRLVGFCRQASPFAIRVGGGRSFTSSGVMSKRSSV